MLNPEDPSTHPHVRNFKSRTHVRGFQPIPAGRMDRKGMGGRIGRSRGLGGNPTAWRSEGLLNYGQSEYLRSFQKRDSQAGYGVGIPTEVWSSSENCIFGSSGRLARGNWLVAHT